jgi:hypothetical protein
MAGPVALPPVDQRESTARSPWIAVRSEPVSAAALSARLALQINKVGEPNRIKDM